MPVPKNQFMDPEEYINELKPSIETLEKSSEGEELKTDKVLRSIAILAHTPCDKAVRALARFTRSNHSPSTILRDIFSHFSAVSVFQ